MWRPKGPATPGRWAEMVEQPLSSLESILSQVPDDEGRDLVRRAYEFAAAAHQGQFRLSGKPYITHAVAVAGLLVLIGAPLVAQFFGW